MSKSIFFCWGSAVYNIAATALSPQKSDNSGKRECANPAINSFRNIELGSYKLSPDKVRTISRVNGRRGYIPRPSCLDYAANMEASFGKKLKQARLTAHLSIPQLAALLHINKRRLQHIELNEVSYDNLTPEFLTDAAIALSLPVGVFLDKYHKFLQGDSAAQLDNWLRANYPSYAEAQRQLSVSEFGLSSWRAGKYPVPRWLYEKMTNK